MQSKRLLWGILGIALICGVFVFSACPTESDDTSGGNTTQGGNGTNTGGNGTNTGGNGTNTGDKGDDTGGNGTNTGGNGTNTGDKGDDTGGNGTNTGGNGDSTGGNGTNTGGNGDSTGGNGTNTGGNGDSTGGNGTNTGGNGTNTGGSGDGTGGNTGGDNTGGGGGTSYTVTFDGNSGSSPSPQNASSGGSITLPSSTRSGYSFNGWYTASSGGTKAGNAGASYTVTSNITLYAQWTSTTPSYTVTFNGNGGSSPSSQPASSGSSITLPSSTRSGYILTGWYTASSGGTKAGNAGASYTVTSNITLYAQWTSSKLPTPTGLSGYSSGSFVQISFNEVPLASSYKLYRSSSASGTYSEITASGGTSGSQYLFTDSSPQSGTRYYKVRAIPPSGYGFTESDLSDYVSVTR